MPNSRYDKTLEKMISEQRLTNGFKTVYPIPEIGMDFNGVVGVVDNDIVYLKFNTFYFSMFVGGENPIDDLYDKYNDLLDNYPDVKGVGVDPDIEEPYDGASLECGVDNQLERAIEYILPVGSRRCAFLYVPDNQ